MKALKRFAILMLVMLLTMATSVSGFAESIDGRVKVEISGTGAVMMQPERAIIRLGVQEQAESVVNAQQAVNKKIAAIIATLEECGVTKENISVGYLSIYANYQYDTSPATIAGYCASHQLVIQTDDVAGVGKLVDAAILAGANQLDGIDFTVIDNSTAYKKAMELAIVNARDKALTIAAAYGKELGDLITVTESANYTLYNAPMALKGSGMADSETQIVAGDLSITATVNVVYELLDQE